MSREIAGRTKKYCLETTFIYTLAIVNGRGCWIENVEGKRYFDFNSNICTHPLGYRHPES